MTRVTRFALLPILAVIPLLTSSVAAQAPPEIDPQTWQRMHQMGLQHRTATDLYAAIKTAAKGGQQRPPFAQLPDWSGLWTAAGGTTFFGGGPTGISPKVTPPAAEALKRGAANEAQNISYDENLSECGPPGYPRWLIVPFLREFIVRPEQTWLSSETVNNVRRIYTDGRGHPSRDEAYPLYYGDSIGFWDGSRLVIHTAQLMARSMGRNQPDQSEQMETVEIWEKTSPAIIEAKVWIFDPAIYTEPWFLVRRYRQVSNPDYSLRMNYWHCSENPNNDVVKTPDGSTQYRDFTFTEKDNR